MSEKAEAGPPIASARRAFRSQIPSKKGIAGGLILAVLLTGGSWGYKHYLKKDTIRGELQLSDSSGPWGTNLACSGSGGLGDIRAGAPVRITNGHGDVIGSTFLEEGTATSPDVCVLPFTVHGVARADFYRFEVSQRGEVTYTRAQVEEQGFDVTLTLGGG